MLCLLYLLLTIFPATIALYGLHMEDPMSPNKQIHASQFQILCALSEKVALKMNVTKRLSAIYKICAL